MLLGGPCAKHDAISLDQSARDREHLPGQLACAEDDFRESTPGQPARIDARKTQVDETGQKVAVRIDARLEEHPQGNHLRVKETVSLEKTSGPLRWRGR